MRAETDRPEALKELADGVWSIALELPDPYNPYSFCYVIQGDDELLLIDPGLDTEANWRTLVDSLGWLGLSVDQVGWVFSTHLHDDHRGMAHRMHEVSGAAVMGLGREIDALQSLAQAGWQHTPMDDWGIPEDDRQEIDRVLSFRPPLRPWPVDLRLNDGDRLPLAGRDLHAAWTPGHTPGHACVVDRSDRLLFTGDHVLPVIFPGLGLGGETDTSPIADYLTSLERVREFDGFSIAPGHEHHFTELAPRLDQLGKHHLRRARETSEVLREHPTATVYEVASQLSWTAGWENLRGFNLFSALNQARLHREFVLSGGLDIASNG